MFYFVVSRIPIISNIEEGKFFRIFIIGTICYIILHAFLYSNYNTGSEFIQNNRSYLYYLWGADLALTGILIKLFGGQSEEIEEDDSEDEDQLRKLYNNQMNNKMTEDEIKRKLEEIKKYGDGINQESAQQLSPYPFIKKEQSKKDQSIKTNEKESEHKERVVTSNNKVTAPINVSEKKENNMDRVGSGLNKEQKESSESQKKPVNEYSDTEIPLYKTV